MRLLLAEDSPALAKSLAQGLREEGYTVDVVGDGESALHLASEVPFDALVLDRLLPKLEGLEVLRRLRTRGLRTPVLVLTALGDVANRVAGLDAGADDYLAKPFDFEELLARLRALVRRASGAPSNVVTAGPLTVDLASHTFSVAGQPLELTAREAAVLELFILKPGVTWTRSQLAEHLYDEATERDSNVLDVFVARLRKKLDAAGLDGSDIIVTQRGRGYRFEPPRGPA